MGYYIEQMESNFYMDKDNVPKAWDSLKELFKLEKKSICDSSGYHYAWIDTATVLDATSFKDAMDEARWTPEFDNDGNIIDLWFNGEKYGGDEDIILNSIAPFVKDGSYVIMQGEQGERWKWKFTDGVVDEIHGHFVFDDEIEDNA